MAQSCLAGVKRLVAEADAAAANASELLRQLDEANRTQIAAVTRAETRATRHEERDNHARQAISAAPRDAAGSIHCDAACLRQLAD